MKKKNLIKKLQLKKTQVSNLSKTKIIGGVDDPQPILTARCTEFRTCNEITITDCFTNRCSNMCVTRTCWTECDC